MEYKMIQVQADRSLGKAEKGLVEELSSIYPEDNLYFEIKDSKIFTYLRMIDLEDFRKTLANLIPKYGLKEVYSNKNPFWEIVEKIEQIKSYGIKGKKRIYVGYDKERKVKDRKLKEKRRGKYYYAKRHDFEKDNNELPDKFIDRIICDDSEVVLRKLPSNSIDLVFTSPPYNFGLDYDTSEDTIDWEKYFDKLFKIFDECIRVLKYGGRIIIDTQPLFSDYIPSHHIISNFFMDRKMIWKGEILWEKNNYNCKYTAWGSWKSPSSPYLKYTWEFLEVFSKGSLKKEGDKENIDITADEFKEWVTAKWSIAPEKDMERYGHPAMFPEELAYRVIKLFSFKNDIILDPFNGVGTTTLVARSLRRKYLGIDISEKYCEKALQRLSERLF